MNDKMLKKLNADKYNHSISLARCSSGISNPVRAMAWDFQSQNGLGPDSLCFQGFHPWKHLSLEKRSS